MHKTIISLYLRFDPIFYTSWILQTHKAASKTPPQKSSFSSILGFKRAGQLFSYLLHPIKFGVFTTPRLFYSTLLKTKRDRLKDLRIYSLCTLVYSIWRMHAYARLGFVNVASGVWIWFMFMRWIDMVVGEAGFRLLDINRR